MKTVGMFLAWAGVAAALQADPQDEYKAKLASINKSAAAKHYAIGEFLTGASMHLWAREQYYKVIDLDPDHDGARKKLGYKKNDDGKWENDPTAKQEASNKKKPEEIERLRKQYVDRQDSAGKDLSRLWGDLALFCKKNTMTAEMNSAFMKALEYDPANVTARKELGYEKDAKGVWMAKSERELRKEMKDGIAKAPGGQPASGESDVETGLGIKTKKQESEHFTIESPQMSSAQLGLILQHGEHTYAMFHKLFGQTDLFAGRKYGFVILKDKPQHDKYVDTFFKVEPVRMKLLHETRATGGFPRTEIYQETAPDALMHDLIIHQTVEACLRHWCGEKHCWVLEGMAMHFTHLMKDSSMIQCIDLAGTSPRNKGKSYTDSSDWPVVCRVWVREGRDPELTAILKRTNFGEFDGADAVKAWSLVEFLLAQHREKFIAFLQLFKDGKEVEAALDELWGWTINDLDYRWKQYVKVAY
jgi:hypothetical protein